MIITLRDFKPKYALARFLSNHPIIKSKDGETFEEFKENYMTYAVEDTMERYPEYFKDEKDKKKKEEMARNIASNLIKKIEEGSPGKLTPK